MPLNLTSNVRRFGLAIMAPALFWACERRSIVAVDVAMVQVSPSTLSIPPGGTGQLTAQVLDANGDVLPGRTVSWSSDDGTVATVNQSGMVSAVANGSAQITATAGGVDGTATVSVDVTGSIELSLDEVMFETEEGGGVSPVNVAVTNGGSGSLTSLQFSVDYGGATSGWLSPSLNQNVTPATLTVGTNAGVVSGLGPGQYSATVMVTAGNASNSPVSLPVTLTISTPDPAIGLNPSSRAFVITEGASSAPNQTVSVSNVGGGSLTGLGENIQYGSGASGWLSASLNRTNAPATLTLSLRSSVSGLGVGVYTANVRVTSGVASNSPQTVAVSLTVGDAPAAIGLETSSVSFQAVEGMDPPDQSVGVTNLGGGSLTGIAVSDDASWLTATRQSGTAPTDIDLAVDVDGLAPGDYSAVVTVTSPVASNSPQTFDVNLEVQAKPVIVLDQDNVAFAAAQGGADPVPVDVSVTNGGEADLTGLDANVASYGSGQPTGWLSAAIVGPTTAPTMVRLTPTVGVLTEGTYTAVVEVTSSFPGVTRDTIDVTLVVSAPALISLDRTSVPFSAPAGSDPGNQNVQITNGGSGSLTDLAISIAYAGGGGQTWLDASSLNKTTATANLTLRVSSASLAPGSYSATVSVTSPVAGNSPQDIAVSLDVTAVPSIALSRTSVAFSTTTGSSPANEAVSVTNGGTGTLSGLG
ncbi:MAG: Ig-like domain-containing protein, partial [Gemmatimonadetes bacterium]|nr:Ig-like domain-containing protein [Gemmatimonadota bacterium]